MEQKHYYYFQSAHPECQDSAPLPTAFIALTRFDGAPTLVSVNNTASVCSDNDMDNAPGAELTDNRDPNNRISVMEPARAIAERIRAFALSSKGQLRPASPTTPLPLDEASLRTGSSPTPFTCSPSDIFAFIQQKNGETRIVKSTEAKDNKHATQSVKEVTQRLKKSGVTILTI